MSALGVLHFRQVIVQKAPLSVENSYGVEVFFHRYADGLMYVETEKGIELTIKVLLTDKKSKQVVWEGDTIVLSRGGAPPKRKGPPPKFEAPVWDHKSLHSVSNKTGLIYSDASGDFNPIHLYWWSALPMGFSRPIAHGMWSLSAAMHELEALKVRKPDAYPLKVVCDFKKPLFMPGKVTFGYKKEQNGDVSFGVYDKNNVDPHLMCTMSQ
jgi:acyl dehydratase